DRTTFMAKIVGICMVTFLIVMNFVSYFSLGDLDKSYDEIHRKSAALVVLGDDKRPDDLRYLVSYSPADGFSTRYKRKGAHINMRTHRVEFQNALLRARFAALPRHTRADFDARVGTLL